MSDFSVGDFYAVPYTDDGFYRIELKKINGQKALAKFIDFGNEDEIKLLQCQRVRYCF